METRSAKMAAVLAFLYVLQVFFDAMFVLFIIYYRLLRLSFNLLA